MSDPNPPANPEMNCLQTSRFGATAAASTPFDSLSQDEDTVSDVMFYTHAPYDLAACVALGKPAPLVCSSLDDLMSYMELDLVSEIVFDSGVSAQEMNYLSRWAKIFKPSVRCSRSAPRQNTAFFSGQQN